MSNANQEWLNRLYGGHFNNLSNARKSLGISAAKQMWPEASKAAAEKALEQYFETGAASASSGKKKAVAAKAKAGKRAVPTKRPQKGPRNPGKKALVTGEPVPSPGKLPWHADKMLGLGVTRFHNMSIHNLLHWSNLASSLPEEFSNSKQVLSDILYKSLKKLAEEMENPEAQPLKNGELSGLAAEPAILELSPN